MTTHQIASAIRRAEHAASEHHSDAETFLAEGTRIQADPDGPVPRSIGLEHLSRGENSLRLAEEWRAEAARLRATA